MDKTGESNRCQALGLSAFLRMAQYARVARDVSMTQSFSNQLGLARMGRSFIDAIDQLDAYCREHGHNLSEQTQQYVGVMDDMEARTRPSDWWERIVKSYVMVGMLTDLEVGLAGRLEPEEKQLLEACQAVEHGQWVCQRVGKKVGEEPALESRLSMWGRRVGGEVLSVCQKLLADHQELLPEASSPVALVQMLSAAHSRRMTALGLTP